MTRAEILARMDSAELSEWLAYEAVFGLPDANLLAAILAPLVARVGGAKKPAAEHFVPLFRHMKDMAKRNQQGRKSGQSMLDWFRKYTTRGDSWPSS